MVRHRIAIAVGLLAVLGGLAALAGALPVVSPPGARAIAGTAGLLVAVGLLVRVFSPGEPAPQPRPDAAELPDRPGAALDDAIASHRVDEQTDVQSRLRRLAVGAIRQRDQLPESAAVARVDDRSWTDDGALAAFLDGDSYVRPPGERDGSWLTDTRWDPEEFPRFVERTVAAIAALGSRRPAGRENRPPSDERPLGEPDRRPPDAFEWPSPTGLADGSVGVLDRQTTAYWWSAVVATLLFLGAGLLLDRPSLLAPSVVSAAFVAFGAVTRPPPTALDAERTLSPPEPDPGETVDVTLTVTNAADRTIPELALFDGVPPALPATGDCARVTSLRPGESVTLQYETVARHGRHRFRPISLRLRDAAGTHAVTAALRLPDDVHCLPTDATEPAAPGLAQRAASFVGELPTATGSGIEFEEVRRYRPGDPLRRIDWRRYASHGELTTVEFTAERSTTVLVGIDVRPAADRAPASGCESAIERSFEASVAVAAGLLDANNSVGLAAFGPTASWIRPAGGSHALQRARLRMGADPAFGVPPATGSVDTVAWERELRQRYPSSAQVVLCAPLCDGTTAFFARRLAALGYPVTVLSPDPTVEETPGERIAAMERALRIAQLRNAGVRVIDWGWCEPVAIAVDRAKQLSGVV